MAAALSLICLFLIAVCGIFLFRPTQTISNSISENKAFEEYKAVTEYSEPAAIQARQEMAAKMAVFLEKNPQFAQAKKEVKEASNETIPAATPIQREVVIQFQNSQLQFRTRDEYDQWVYENVKNDPAQFIKQIHASDNPELYLDTLQRVTELEPNEEVVNQVKSAILDEAKNLITNPDGFHQQMTQKALQQYLDLEPDKEKAKKIVDEFLKKHQSQ